MSDFPKKVEIAIDEQRYWEGLGRQEMDFHQVLGELIDNSISASGKDRYGELLPFEIEITIEKVGDIIKITVADSGIGMSETELIRGIFSPGGKGKSEGPLNEHGFGLKNALCVLTNGNRLSWHIQTRDHQTIKKNLFYLVEGPFSSNISVKLGNKSDWSKDLKHAISESGTRVYVETPFDFFRSLHRISRTFDTLIERLIEHLSVIYRQYLTIHHNKMWLRWKSSNDIAGEPFFWEDVRITPIEIPYDSNGFLSTDFEITGPNGISTVRYIRGKLDEEKIRDMGLGRPYPLKIYYQGKIPTQGLDIIVRGRLIKTGQLPEIWAEIPRHNNLNSFVGELIISDDKFRTVNNKISLDPHNPYWNTLLEKLEDDAFKPEKVTSEKTERNLAKKLKTILEGYETGSTIHLNRKVWSGTSVEIDVFHELKDGEINIYELKAGTAGPIDSYQLLMYWDGVVVDLGKSPKKARLIAKEIPKSVENMIKEINKKKDFNGTNYNLECKTIKEMGLEDL